MEPCGGVTSQNIAARDHEERELMLNEEGKEENKAESLGVGR